MSTKAQIKKVVRLVQEREPRLIYQDRRLFLPPAGHYARGFMFDRSAAKGIFNLRYFVLPLYVPDKGYSIGPGGDIFPVRGGVLWDIGIEGIDEILADTILERGMPRIEAEMTPSNFVRYLKSVDASFFYSEHLMLTFMLLHRHNKVLSMLDKDLEFVEGRLADPSERYPNSIPMWEARRRRVLRFAALVRDGFTRTDRLLRGWEEMMVRRYKVEAFWRSPWAE